MAAAAPIDIRRHDGDGHAWETASRPPAAALASLVRGYVGYTEHAARTVRRLQVPFSGLPLIVSFGPSLRVTDPTAGDGGRAVTSFLAGLHDRFVVTEYRGAQAGVQVDLTPLGAAVLFRGVAAEAANRVVDLSDVLGAATAEALEGRLADTNDWAARFDRIDRLLLDRLAAATAPPAGVAAAWRRIAASHGATSVEGLAREFGWSRKHLAVRMRQELGLAPKTLARVVRFERAVTLLGTAAAQGRADLAAWCGYADQAHFNRDFRAFAGCTPGDYLASRLPGGLGVAAA
jgi:AraC-like DNA-binding protein